MNHADSNSGLGLTSYAKPPRLQGYKIFDVLGRGGEGTVYRAMQTKLERIVALKVLHPSAIESRNGIARFEREARLTANLDHPRIAKVYDFGETTTTLYLVRQYVEGISLAGLLQKRGLAPRRAAELMIEVAEIVEYLHSRGVIHRDLKPSNILVDVLGSPCLIDLGLATEPAETSIELTRAGHMMGTKGYAAPEQAAGELERVGPAADIYSLGATLYTILAGRPPHSGDEAHGVIPGPSASLVSPSYFNPSIPEALDEICRRSLDKNPDARYLDAGEFTAALKAYLEGDGGIRAGSIRELSRTNHAVKVPHSIVRWIFPGTPPQKLAQPALMMDRIVVVGFASAISFWASIIAIQICFPSWDRQAHLNAIRRDLQLYISVGLIVYLATNGHPFRRPSTKEGTPAPKSSPSLSLIQSSIGGSVGIIAATVAYKFGFDEHVAFLACFFVSTSALSLIPKEFYMERRLRHFNRMAKNGLIDAKTVDRLKRSIIKRYEDDKGLDPTQ